MKGSGQAFEQDTWQDIAVINIAGELLLRATRRELGAGGRGTSWMSQGEFFFFFSHGIRCTKSITYSTVIRLSLTTLS
jgi:hypothetical protein